MAALHLLRAGSGPALLLLHGIGSSGTAWSRQLQLLQNEFACLAPDLPGYGDSPDPAGDTLENLVQPLADLLQGQPAHLVGVSFGALAALTLARLHPGLVRSMVLADATLGRRHLPQAERERWLDHRLRLAGELATRSSERAAEIAGRGAAPEVVEEIAAHMRRARPAGYVAVARAIAQTDARPWLPRILAPALVLCGEDDRVTGPEVSATLARGLPQARLLTIAAAGHAPHIEQPLAFAEAVRGFVREMAGGQPG